MSAKEIYAKGGVKACGKCGMVQPIDRGHFGSHGGGRSVRSTCRQCQRDAAKRNHKKNPT